MDFGEKLTQLRKEAGFKTPKDFANYIDIPYTSYRSYEKGAWPSREYLLKIAAALNVSIDELLGYRTNEFEKCKASFEGAGWKIHKIENDFVFWTMPRSDFMFQTKIPEFTKWVTAAIDKTMWKMMLFLDGELAISFLNYKHGKEDDWENARI